MLKLVEFVNFFKTGTSQCFLGLCDDNMYWVIRNKKRDYNSKRLFAQFIASHLAKLMGISTPLSTIVKVNIDELNPLPNNYVEFDIERNIGVGTIFIKDLKHIPTPPKYDEVLSSPNFGNINQNHLKNLIPSEKQYAQLYGMKVFASWVYIDDFHKYENLCLDSKNNIVFLDFDKAFSSSNGSWEIPNNYDFDHQAPFWEGLYENQDMYDPWFTRLKNLDIMNIKNIFSQIPKCWEVPERYQNSLIEYLYYDRNQFISEFIEAYEYRNNER